MNRRQLIPITLDAFSKGVFVPEVRPADISPERWQAMWRQFQLREAERVMTKTEVVDDWEIDNFA